MTAPASSPKAFRDWKIYFFVLPALVLIAVFSYFPAASAIYHSFFDWQGGDSKQFLGWNNFRRAFDDRVLWNSFLTVGCLVVFNVFKMVPSIAMAVVIHRLKSDRWQYLYRVLLVVPMIVPALVTLFIWKFIYDPNIGLLNRVLDATGGKTALVWLDSVFGWNVFQAGVPIGWLSQPELVLPSLFLWGFPWIGAVGVLIYLAGLQSIGTEIYEAAELDGVGPIRKFFHIELPLILTQVRLTLTLLVISTLQGYGLQLLLLGDTGGPGGRGLTPGLWMYNRAFIAGEFGYACAIGLVLFVFILILTLLNQRLVRRDR
jgi:ABC-type sugar transport system permease subunit